MRAANRSHLKKQIPTVSIYLYSYWLSELDSAKVCKRQISEKERFLLEIDDSLTQTLENKAKSEISVRLLAQEERSNLESYEIYRLGHADKYFFRERDNLAMLLISQLTGHFTQSIDIFEVN